MTTTPTVKPYNQLINNTPLVSIIVITYNSAKYVLETLESAKAQTYQNIELIVSDDCSTDNTIEICYEWIEENKDRFIRTKLITFEKNTGVAPNCNRGVCASNGEWVKLIAGDDILLLHSIEKNIKYTFLHKKAAFIFSNMFSFNCNERIEKKIEMKSNEDIFNKGYKQQHKHLVMNYNFVYAPTNFMNSIALHKFGLFDENIPMVEDFPFWLKLTKKGEKLYLLNETTVLYRKHNSSINSSAVLSNKYNLAMWEVFKRYMLKDAMRYDLLKGWHLLLTYWSGCYNRNKWNYRKYSLLLSPIFILNKINRIYSNLRKQR